MFRDFIVFTSVLVLVYYLTLMAIYLYCLLISRRGLIAYFKSRYFGGEREIFESNLTPLISIIVPAHNEEKSIVESVNSLRKLQYAHSEVIVVNDGSADRTLEVLIKSFGLVKVDRMLRSPRDAEGKELITTMPVRGIYVSRDSSDVHDLIVVDKVNGGKSDALNAGILASRHSLICTVDADSILERNAIVKAVKPFLKDPEGTIGVGGVIRLANGCVFSGGKVSEVRLPGDFLPAFQTVEYLRSFLGSRFGLSQLNGLLIVSGVFAMLRKDLVLEVGGYNVNSLSEDMEIIVRVTEHELKKGKKRRVVFVPDPIAWTEAPTDMATLSRQRNRWQRGLIQTLFSFKHMLFNPSYGSVGLLAIPFLYLEMIGPVVEIYGFATIPLFYFTGRLEESFFVLFLFSAVLFGILLSTLGILLQEFSEYPFTRFRDVAGLFSLGVLENFGYRHLTLLWRLRAFYDYFRRRKEWGVMERTGFGETRKPAKNIWRGFVTLAILALLVAFLLAAATRLILAHAAGLIGR
ncbi:MAG: glycosyltransferase [Candidatus Eisenbacteria bacterium]|nr:glycosyltransferase [Candidatus Eisenbacteria bacterium]